MKLIICLPLIAILGLLLQIPMARADSAAKSATVNAHNGSSPGATGASKLWTTGVDDEFEVSIMTIPDISRRAVRLCLHLRCKLGVDEGARACYEKVKRWRNIFLIYLENHGREITLEVESTPKGNGHGSKALETTTIYDRTSPKGCDRANNEESSSIPLSPVPRLPKGVRIGPIKEVPGLE